MFNTEINTEIEYKFWANISRRQFHEIVENIAEESISPRIIESDDDYYTSEGHQGFLRHRMGISFQSGNPYAEITVKRKINGNAVRKEVDLNMINNKKENVRDFLSLANYKFHFTISKKAWIYHFDDCDVSYYTLRDGRDVIEIEAKPEAYSTLEEGIKIINEWMKLLKLTESERESRSLFEIFSDEKSE